MKAIKKSVLIKIDMRQKEKLQLTKDIEIHIVRGFDFNLRRDRSTYAYVVDGGDLKAGTPILVHYLSTEPTYEVQGENILTEEEKREGYSIRKIDDGMIFCFYDGTEWQPCKGFLITKRIFKAYSGLMVGIEHEWIKKRLYIEKGLDEWDGEVTDLAGKVCVVTENSDVELIFHNEKHEEGRVIRTMHREIECIDHTLTEQVNNGELLIGLAPNNCKTLN